MRPDSSDSVPIMAKRAEDRLQSKERFLTMISKEDAISVEDTLIDAPSVDMLLRRRTAVL